MRDHVGMRCVPFLLVFACTWAIVSCASFEPTPLPVPPAQQVTHSAKKEGVRVATKILSDEQARQHYGVDLASRGLQAVWIKIRNESPIDLWFLIAALDPDYFSADEAAYLFYASLSDENEGRLLRHFRNQSIPLLIKSDRDVEGYVLAPRREGGRYVNVELVGHEKRLRFGFALAIADEAFDFDEVEPGKIYGDGELPNVGADGLRARVRELPCCTADRAGEGPGDPLNIAIVADQNELMTVLARSGWSFTHRIDVRSIVRVLGAALTGTSYPIAPISPLYLFGRSQDIALQRARSSIAQRNHLRLWLAPFRYEGRPVWVGQVSRDIGIKVTSKAPTLTTHVIDPQVDEAREYLLQSLLVHHAVEKFGFLAGVGSVEPHEPRQNLTGDPYFTDGLRLVVVLARDLVPPQSARNFHWREVEDPVLRSRDSKESAIAIESPAEQVVEP